jgi:putative ABC transport system permease protein
MDALRQDLRVAVAAMRRAPLVSLAAIVTLALGIGSTLAVVATVHGILLRPLPYAAPDRLVRLWEERPGGASPAGNRWLSRGTYVGLRGQSHTLEAVGGYGVVDVQVSFGQDHVKLPGARISADALATLGVPPLAGRLLTDTDDHEGAVPVVVLSHALWRERYAADPAVIGRVLSVDGAPRTIVGVMPASFAFPEPGVRLWVPYQIPRTTAAPGGAQVFTALGRLKPGLTPDQVEAEGTAAARAAPSHRLSEFFFGTGSAPVVHARPLAEDLTLAARPGLAILTVAVALLLLIACANVAGLMLSQAAARTREFAIRTAVGAGRGRLLRQVLTESAVIAGAGSGLGLILGAWLLHAVRVVAPATLPRLADISLDGPVLALWVLTSGLALGACALGPAVRSARVDAAETLQGADRSAATGFRGAAARRLRDGLLVVEAALAIVLIVGATLLVRSFSRLVSVDAGYSPSSVLVAAVELPPDADAARMDRFLAQALERVRHLPGVSAAGAGAMIPLMKGTAMTGFTIPESAAGGKPTHGRARVYWVTPGFAEALGLRRVQGRFLADGDRDSGPLAVVVNEELVRQHLGSADAVGLRLPGLLGGDAAATAEIVGVVGNVLKDGNDKAPQPELYVVHGAHGQRIAGRVHLVLRTAAAPSALAVDVRSLLRAIDGGVVIDRVEPLDLSVAAALDGPRFAAGIMGAFAGVAMLLAGIGLYGALAYSVSQRDRELGIRSALGAGRRDLVRLILGEGLLVTVPGIALGILGAVGFTRLMRDLLFGVTPLDGVAFALAPALLVATALVACLVPALRAASADPAVTLRK